jgi:hypothetical protein
MPSSDFQGILNIIQQIFQPRAFAIGRYQNNEMPGLFIQDFCINERVKFFIYGQNINIATKEGYILKKAKAYLVVIVCVIGFTLIIGGFNSLNSNSKLSSNAIINPTSSVSATPQQISLYTQKVKQQSSKAIVSSKNTSHTKTPATDISIQVVSQADKIKGVKAATAFVYGKDIYMGLVLNSVPQNKIATIKKNVIAKVNNLEPGYTVLATCDKNTVAEIKTVAQSFKDITAKMIPRATLSNSKKPILRKA